MIINGERHLLRSPALKVAGWHVAAQVIMQHNASLPHRAALHPLMLLEGDTEIVLPTSPEAVITVRPLQPEIFEKPRHIARKNYDKEHRKMLRRKAKSHPDADMAL